MPDDLLTVQTADGRKLETILSGPADGLPAVFHMGTPMGLVPLPSLLDPAQCGLRTVFYARPGYAGSSAHPGRCVGDAATDTATILDAIGADGFVALGWSGGGPHALACAALLPHRCLATAVIGGLVPFSDAPEVYTMGDAEYADYIRRVQAGDESELVKNSEDRAAKWSGRRAEEMPDNFTCQADRECMTGEFAEWLAAQFRAAAAGIEGYREDYLAFYHDWGFRVAQARRAAIWHGAEDGNVPVANGVWLADHIPNAELHILPHEGHESVGLRFREIFEDLISRSKATDRVGT